MYTPKNSLLIILAFVAFTNLLHGQSLSSANPFFVGHSLVNFDMPHMLSELAKASGKYYNYNQQICNGAPLWWNYENYAGCQGTPYVQAFPQGNHDVLVVTEAIPLQNHLTWSNTYANARKFLRYALDNNQNRPLRYYIYETWHCIHTGTTEGCPYDNGDSLTWQPRLRTDFRLWRSIVDSVRHIFPSEEVWMVPAGQAFYNLTEAINKGELPGVQDFRHFFTDDIHLTNAGNYFVALVMYACIFRESPEGLPSRLTGRFGGDITGLPSTAQAAVMQRVAWETVTALSDISGVKISSETDNAAIHLAPIKVVPNPSNDHIQVIHPGELIRITVTDQSGSPVLHSKTASFSVSDLLPGIYHVRVLTHFGVQTGHLVKM